MGYCGKQVDFSVLKGCVLTNVVVAKSKKYYFDGDHIIFERQDGREYYLFHPQNCCERVFIEDICGDIDDPIGSPILVAEERNNEERDFDGQQQEWTFYELATVKGSVTIRWYGASNGYYSTSVNLYELSGE